MIYVFLNRLSNNGKGGEAQLELEKIFKGQQLKFIDITAIKDYEDIKNIQKLSIAFDSSKLILLLDNVI